MPRFKPSPIAAAVASASALAFMAMPAFAQENMLHGMGWIGDANPGSQLQSSQVVVSGNQSRGEVSVVGLGASVGFGAAGLLRLIATAQINSIGIDAAAAQGSTLAVTGNTLSGPVDVLGGAATANSILFSGQGERKRLSNSSIHVSGNEAGAMMARGGELFALLASASLQMPGRATANSVLLQSTDVVDAQIVNADNRANAINSIGGAALANALTASQSQLNSVRIYQRANDAQTLYAAGGSASLGYGAVGEVKLEGAALASSMALANSTLTDSLLVQQNNRAQQISGLGGGAQAQAITLTDVAQASQLRVLQDGNDAQNIQAHGGSGSILAGAIASVDNSASALANSVNLDRSGLDGENQLALTDNQARDILAKGGVAMGNSVWALDAALTDNRLALADNSAARISTNGGSATALGGVLGASERYSRAGANSVVVADGAALQNMDVAIARNRADLLDAQGGQAMANSLLADQGAHLQDGRVALQDNRATDVFTTGGSDAVLGGLLWQAQQDAVALANSVAVVGSELSSLSLLVRDNQVRGLLAEGGSITANAVSLERGDGSGSRLGAQVQIAGNEASNVTTQAQTSGNALSRSHTRARAALNAVLLHDGAEVDAQSSVQVQDNTARAVSALGGTALLQSLAAYRGAQIERTQVLLADNQAQQIEARGDHHQTLGSGAFRHGIAVANSVYLEGQHGARITDGRIELHGNQARNILADGAIVQANALALSQGGVLSDTTVQVRGNRVESVTGFAQTTRGLFGLNERETHAELNLNALDIQSRLSAGNLWLIDNWVSGVDAQQGSVTANSVTVTKHAGLASSLEMTIIGNRASGLSASGGQEAVANSVQHGGSLGSSQLAVVGNTAGVRADTGHAVASSVQNEGSVSSSLVGITGNRSSVTGSGTVASVHNQASGQIGQSGITILGNQASASQGGTNASVINSGRIASANITVLGNQGSAQGGTANSVRNSGQLSGNIAIIGNRGSAGEGGTVNSVDNRGRLSGNITIVGNQGRASDGGIANSVSNRGSMDASVTIAANQGTASSGGTANSVRNSGQLSGRITIAGNDGRASGGGTANSVVNRGSMNADVTITANRGTASMNGVSNSVVNNGVMNGRVLIAANDSHAVGGTANSVINHGVMAGSVNIVGNRSGAAAGMTSGSVVNAGALVGSAGVAAGAVHVASPGYTYSAPSTGVMNQSVLIVPAYNFVFQ